MINRLSPFDQVKECSTSVSETQHEDKKSDENVAVHMNLFSLFFDKNESCYHKSVFKKPA